MFRRTAELKDCVDCIAWFPHYSKGSGLLRKGVHGLGLLAVDEILFRSK